MKALKLFIGLILLSLALHAQSPQKIVTWYEYQKFNVKTSFVPPRDTLSGADSGAIASRGNHLYIKNGHWTEVGGTAGGIDDVLAVGQILTTSRTIDAGANFMTIEGSYPGGSHGTLQVTNSAADGMGMLVNGGTTNGIGIEVGVNGSGSIGIYVVPGNATGVYVAGGDDVAGYFSNATASPTNPALMGVTDEGLAFVGLKQMATDNNSVQPVAEYIRGVTFPTTAANGIGGSVNMLLQDDGGSRNLASSIITRMTSVTSATRTAQYKVALVNSGSMADVLIINGDGTLEAPGIAHWVNAANNAAAIAASVPVGRFYRNGDVVQVVH